MKYTVTVVKEDKKILDGVNRIKLAEMIGCTPSYLSYLANGHRIANEQFYNRIKKAKLLLTK